MGQCVPLGFFCRPLQDNPSFFGAVPPPSPDRSTLLLRRGLTLTEILATITVMAALALLAVPGWSALTRSHARKAGPALVMEAMERARSEAITTKKPVWVLFRHSSGRTGDDMRIMAKGESSFLPLGSWMKLPQGITFRPESGTLLDEKPSEEILSAAINGSSVDAPPGGSVGSVMFRPTGSVGYPSRGGNQLTLGLDSTGGISCGLITLSRATGRPAMQ